MNKLFFPLDSFKETFSVLYLVSKFDANTEFDSLTNAFNEVLGCNYKEKQLKIAIDKYFNLMNLNLSIFKNLIKKIDDSACKKKKTICQAPFSNCKRCASSLKVENKILNCVVFTKNGPKEGYLLKKYCEFCNIYYECDNYSTVDKKKYIYNPNEDIQLIMTSKETVFEISFLKEYDKHLIRNATTFSGFTDVYNVDNELVCDRNLYIKRFEEAWFTWKLRTWIFRKNCANAANLAAFNSKDIESELKKWLQQFQEIFVDFWYNAHISSSHGECKHFCI